MLAKLSTSDWERLELEAMKLLNLKNEQITNTSDSIEERVTQAEEEYIKSDSNLVRKRELLALNSTLDTQNINSGTTNDSINKNKAM